jgi:hypothetical protein
MSFLKTIGRPIDWPSPYSLTARALGWVHYILAAAIGLLCGLGWWVTWAVGFVAGLCVVIAAVSAALPVLALFALGFVLRAIARRAVYA